VTVVEGVAGVASVAVLAAVDALCAGHPDRDRFDVALWQAQTLAVEDLDPTVVAAVAMLLEPYRLWLVTIGMSLPALAADAGEGSADGSVADALANREISARVVAVDGDQFRVTVRDDDRHAHTAFAVVPGATRQGRQWVLPMARAAALTIWRLRCGASPQVRLLCTQAVRSTTPTAIGTGARIEPDGDGWRVPMVAAVPRNVAAIRARFANPMIDGADLRVGPIDAAALVDLSGEMGWICDDSLHKAAQHLRDRCRRSGNIVDAGLVIDGLDPDFELQHFQTVGVEFVIETGGRCLISDEPGLGKTAISLASIAALDAFPAIVVCKAGLKLNWDREIATVLAGRTATIVTGTTPAAIEPADVVIINFDILVERLDDLIALNAGGIIVDESHLTKELPTAPTSARNYLKAKAEGNKKKKRPVGSMRVWALIELCTHIRTTDGAVLLLSATNRPNRAREFWPQLLMVGHDETFGGWKPFSRRFCDGAQRFGRWDAEGSTNEEQLGVLLRSTCMLRRTQAQANPQLPALIHTRIEVTMNAANTAAYRKAEVNAKRVMPGMSQPDQRREFAVLRKAAAEAKLPAVFRWLDDFIAGEETGRPEKVVVFAHHRDVQQALAERYGNIWLRALSDQKPAEAERIKAQFQTDEDTRVIICGPGAKEGHTLTAAEHVAIIEPPWTWADAEQMAGRVYGRLNDAHGGQVWWLSCDDTVDRLVHRVLDRKRTGHNATMNPADELVELFLTGH
jgi:superfamily II DNA or RNA helicase